MKSKDSEDIDQEEASSIQGGIAATSKDEITEVHSRKDTIIENGRGRPDVEKLTHATDAVGRSLALKRPDSTKHKGAKGADADEDRVEQLETAGSDLLKNYEAPVPNLDYLNRRKKALRTKSSHSANSEKAVPRITNSNESARQKASQPSVSKEQRTNEAVEGFYNALDGLMLTEEAKANLLVEVKSKTLKPGQCLKIEAKKSPEGSPLKWHNQVRLVKGQKVDGEQIELSADGGLAVSSRLVLLDDRLIEQLGKEQTSPDSLDAGSETTSEQKNMLYSSYRHRRKKGLLQMQAKQTQLRCPIVSPLKTEDAGDATDEPGEQQDIGVMKTTAKSDHRGLVSGKYIRVYKSGKVSPLRSESRGSGLSTLTQETPIGASKMPEPRSDGGPAPEFRAKYQALEKLKQERGWGKYWDPNTVEPSLGDQTQSSPTEYPLMNAESDPKDDDLTGTAKFFHKKLSTPHVQPKRLFVNNTPVLEKLNPEARLSLEEQYRSSQRVAEDESIESLQPSDHITHIPSPSPPPKASKEPRKPAKRKERWRALARRTAARQAGHLRRKAKKLAKIEKSREIQAKYTALREKLRRERRGGLVGDREIGEKILEEGRGSVKWMGEM